MAISIGDVVAKLGLDTKNFDAGIKGVGATLKKHNKAIGVGMTALGAGILAVGILSVKTYASMGDEVQKMAFRTGFATEALSEWRHVAEISGATLSGLDKATKTMSKTLVDASEGMTTYIRAYDRLGLSVDELRKLSPEKQFETITMAIAGLEDHTLKAATASDIFGRAGVKLLPMLALGADGIKELREEARELGIVFSQEAADKAAQFNDDLLRMKRSVDGVKIKIAEALMPTLISLAQKITDVIKGIGDWIKENPALAKAITIAAAAIGGLLLVLGPLMIMLPGIIAIAPAVGAAFGVMFGPIGLAVIAVAALVAGFVLLWKGLKSPRDAIDNFRGKIEDTNEKLADAKIRLNEFAEAGEDATPAVIELKDEIANLESEIVALNVGLEDAVEKSQPFITAIWSQVTATSALFKTMKDFNKELNEAWIEGFAIRRKLTEEAVAEKEAVKEAAGAAINWAQIKVLAAEKVFKLEKSLRERALGEQRAAEDKRTADMLFFAEIRRRSREREAQFAQDKINAVREAEAIAMQKSVDDALMGALAKRRAKESVHRLELKLIQEIEDAQEEASRKERERLDTLPTFLEYMYDVTGKIMGRLRDIRKAYTLVPIPGMAGMFRYIEAIAKLPAVPAVPAVPVAPPQLFGDAMVIWSETIKRHGIHDYQEWLSKGMPQFAKGGKVLGPIGAPVLAMVHGGETITPAGKGFQTANIIIELDGMVLAEVMGQPLVDTIRVRTAAGM